MTDDFRYDDNRGLSMEPTLMEVEARELPAPRLMYKKTVDPREGVWDSMRETFHTPKRIENWCDFVPFLFQLERFC